MALSMAQCMVMHSGLYRTLEAEFKKQMEVTLKPQLPSSSGISVTMVPEGTCAAGSPSLHLHSILPPAFWCRSFHSCSGSDGLPVIIEITFNWLQCKESRLLHLSLLLASNYFIATETSAVRTVALGAVSMDFNRMEEKGALSHDFWSIILCVMRSCLLGSFVLLQVRPDYWNLFPAPSG